MIGFDRDGVLVGVLGDWEKCHPKHYNNSVEMPLIQEVIAKINEPCVVISNQQGVKWGYSSLESVVQQFQWLQSQVPQIQASFFCPDEGKSCWVVRGESAQKVERGLPGVPGFESFRKPHKGMWQMAVLLGLDIDKYIGDLSGNPSYAEGKDSDRQFAVNCGIEYQDVNDFIAS